MKVKTLKWLRLFCMGFPSRTNGKEKTWVNLWLESILKIGSHVRLVAWYKIWLVYTMFEDPPKMSKNDKIMIILYLNLTNIPNEFWYETFLGDFQTLCSSLDY